MARNANDRKRPGARKVLFHCHIVPEENRAFERDEKTGLVPGTVEHLLRLFGDLGFDAAVAISPEEVPPGRCTARIDEAKDGLAWLAARAKGRENLLLFANLDPSKPGAADRLLEAREMRFTGVKLHPAIGRFSIDPERDKDFYEIVNRFRMPVIVHTGTMPGAEEVAHKECRPEKVARLAEAFGDIPVIMAHGGGGRFSREALSVMERRPNTFLDLTHTLDEKYAWHIPADDLKTFFDRFGPSRIIYGVDYPWFSPDDFERDMAFLAQLGLDENDKDMLLGRTFDAILRKAVV